MNQDTRQKALCLTYLILAITTRSAVIAAEPEFVYALRGKPAQSLSPFDAYTTNDLAVVSHITEGLVKFDPLKSEAAPKFNLASDGFEIDQRTYVFVLRDDIYFHPFPKHPKDRVTAADVKFSLEYGKRSRSPLADRLKNIETIEIFGDTIKIKLREPAKDLMAILATTVGHITSQRYYESLGRTHAERDARFRLAPIGTGPYRLSRPLDARSRTIELERFTGYRDKVWRRSTRSVPFVKFAYYDDPREILKAIKAGRVAMTTLPVTEFGTGVNVREAGSFTMLTPPFLVLLAINAAKEPWRGIRMRQLLNAAVESEKVAVICQSDLDNLPPGYRKYMQIPRDYLKEHGSGQRLQTELADPAIKSQLAALRRKGPLKILAVDRPDHIMDRILASVESDLERNLQIEVVIVKKPSVSLDTIRSENPDLIYREWTPDTPWEYADLSILKPLFASASRNNYGGYHDASVDALFERLQGITDQGTKDKMYKEVQERLRTGAPVVWLPVVRQWTCFLKNGYTAPRRKERVPSTSTLVYYTPLLKEIRRQR